MFSSTDELESVADNNSFLNLDDGEQPALLVGYLVHQDASKYHTSIKFQEKRTASKVSIQCWNISPRSFSFFPDISEWALLNDKYASGNHIIQK